MRGLTERQWEVLYREIHQVVDLLMVADAVLPHCAWELEGEWKADGSPMVRLLGGRPAPGLTVSWHTARGALLLGSTERFRNKPRARSNRFQARKDRSRQALPRRMYYPPGSVRAVRADVTRLGPTNGALKRAATPAPAPATGELGRARLQRQWRGLGRAIPKLQPSVPRCPTVPFQPHPASGFAALGPSSFTFGFSGSLGGPCPRVHAAGRPYPVTR